MPARSFPAAHSAIPRPCSLLPTPREAPAPPRLLPFAQDWVNALHLIFVAIISRTLLEHYHPAASGMASAAAAVALSFALAMIGAPPPSNAEGP